MFVPEKQDLFKAMHLSRRTSNVLGLLPRETMANPSTFSFSRSVSCTNIVLLCPISRVPVVYSTGVTPHFELTKGFVIKPPNLVTRSLLNCLETLPTPHPNIIAISSSGVTHTGHQKLPLLLKPFYGYFLATSHADKCGAEEVLAYCAGWEWEAEDCPGAEVLGRDWKSNVELPIPGTLKDVVVVRPALMTNGVCRGDAWDEEAEHESHSEGPYKVEDGDLVGRWTISRKDVAHFVVERVVRHWNYWKGKRVSVAY